MSANSILDRELYDVAVAAKVLCVPRSTLMWWLEGGERRGRVYQPVLRPEPRGTSVMSWGEVVEAGYLAGYRKQLRVQLWRLRHFIMKLRDDLGVSYPLATARPWVGPGRRLLIKASEGLAPQLRPGLIEPSTGQMVLMSIAEHFLARVEFQPPGEPEGVAVRIRPFGKDSPVVIDPEVRFGMPSVQGIATAALSEKIEAGEPIEAVADAYNIPRSAVIAAVQYEATNWPLQLTAA
jgi:uncharacterized protein (DUF433 family)